MNEYTKNETKSFQSRRLTTKPIPENYTPKNILVIRLHSLGDIAITFPYCFALRNLFPEAKIDFLTSKDFFSLPDSLDLFDNTYEINIELFKKSNMVLKAKKYFRALNLSSHLKRNNYDVILDLQNNNISRLIRRKIKPKYFGEFDSSSPLPAGQRTLNTFIKTGFHIEPLYKVRIKAELLNQAKDILVKNNWDETKKIFVLNPAGLWITRNWMVENYVQLAKIMLSNYNSIILFLGNERIKDKAEYISSCIGNNVINLLNKTTLDEVFAVLQFASAIISEDSGLMHMAWVSGIPTIALLGSSRADWTSPLGDHSVSLNSSDLECGSCMSFQCKYNDIHCLTRYSPEFVFKKLKNLI